MAAAGSAGRPAPADLGGLNDLLDLLTCPVRCGLILTRRGLAGGAAAAGAGHRIGERRFTLRALLDQAPAETLGWLRRGRTLVPAARHPGGNRPGAAATSSRPGGHGARRTTARILASGYKRGL